MLEAPWRSDWGGRVLVDGEPVAVPAANPYELELTNFAAAIAGEGEPLLGRDDAVAAGARDRGALPLGGVGRGSPALMLAELAAQLVAVDSVNPTLVPDGGGEAAVARVLAEWLERARASRSRSTRSRRAGRTWSAIARGSGGGRTLILNGHLDTVGLLEPGRRPCRPGRGRTPLRPRRLRHEGEPGGDRERRRRVRAARPARRRDRRGRRRRGGGEHRHRGAARSAGAPTRRSSPSRPTSGSASPIAAGSPSTSRRPAGPPTARGRISASTRSRRWGASSSRSRSSTGRSRRGPPTRCSAPDRSTPR